MSYVFGSLGVMYEPRYLMGLRICRRFSLVTGLALIRFDMLVKVYHAVSVAFTYEDTHDEIDIEIKQQRAFRASLKNT